MPKERNYQSNLECVVRIKGITTRPIPFSQLRRRDGEYFNPKELFADCHVEVSEEERLHQERLDFIMADIIDWAISQLSWANAETIRAIHFEGKTVDPAIFDLLAFMVCLAVVVNAREHVVDHLEELVGHVEDEVDLLGCHADGGVAAALELQHQTTVEDFKVGKLAELKIDLEEDGAALDEHLPSDLVLAALGIVAAISCVDYKGHIFASRSWERADEDNLVRAWACITEVIAPAPVLLVGIGVDDLCVAIASSPCGQVRRLCWRGVSAVAGTAC